ncbi:hypothetical protein KKF91_02835 [Myxococcota bacterium]|nr:hypothetical protein [Myxococcota bacterium]MBU1429475.1 hypothetical protein [Myxococcota bacterium]MBU1896149.1 hypothetical protein [Myxococcota bacterium]
MNLRNTLGLLAVLGLISTASAQEAPVAPVVPAVPAAIAAPAAPAAGGFYVGVWGIDISSLAEMDEFKQMPPEQQKMALEQAAKMMGEATFEFTADQRMIMSFGGEKKEGTYKIVSDKDGKVVMEGTMMENGQPDTETLTLQMNGPKLKITGPDGKTITFIRK